MSSSPTPTDPERGEGKGSNDDDDDDPAEDFEDDPDSEAAADAQQTLDEIDSQIDSGEESPPSESDSSDRAATGGDEMPSLDANDRHQPSNEATDHSLAITDEGVFTADELADDDTASEIADSLYDASVDDIQTLSEDNLTPNTPDTVNIDSATRFEQMEMGDDTAGMFSSLMWKGETPDGDEMYITFSNSTQSAQPLEMTQAASALNASLSEDGQQRANFPNMHVDEERGAAVLASAGADDVKAASQYRSDESSDGFSKQDYHDAVAAKVLMGDTDISQNIVTSSQGNFHPIDYDFAGEDIATEDTEYREDDGTYADVDGYMDYASDKAQHGASGYDFEVTEDSLRQSVQDLANEVDVDELESQLDQAEPLISKDTKNTMVKNIKTAQQGDV